MCLEAISLIPATFYTEKKRFMSGCPLCCTTLGRKGFTTHHGCRTVVGLSLLRAQYQGRGVHFYVFLDYNIRTHFMAVKSGSISPPQSSSYSEPFCLPALCGAQPAVKGGVATSNHPPTGLLGRYHTHLSGWLIVTQGSELRVAPPFSNQSEEPAEIGSHCVVVSSWSSVAGCVYHTGWTPSNTPAHDWERFRQNAWPAMEIGYCKIMNWLSYLNMYVPYYLPNVIHMYLYMNIYF